LENERRNSVRRPIPLPDAADSYIESTVSQADTDSMKNAIRMLADAQRDPWRGFDDLDEHG
jgi:hypothetical protein